MGRPKTAFPLNLNNARVVQDNVSGIMHRVDGIKLDDSTPVASLKTTSRHSSSTLTQGDKLNQIKARRRRLRVNQSTLSGTPTGSSTVVQ